MWYIPGGNVLDNNDGNMGVFYDRVFEIKDGEGYRSAMANVEWKIIRIRSMMKTETMFSGINGMEKKSQIRNMKRN